MTAQRIYPGSTVTLQTVVTVSGAATDASAITIKWRIGRKGSVTTLTPTRSATGTYSVTITPTKAGNLHYRWDTEGALDYSEEGTLLVADTQFAGNL